MNFDFERTLLSYFGDEEWKKKILILTLFSLSNAALILLDTGILSWIPTCIFTGYCLYFMHNTTHDIKPFLPSWKYNFLKYFKYGLIFSIIICIYVVISILFLILFKIIQMPYTMSMILVISIFSLVTFCASAVYSDKFEFREAFALRKLLKIIIKAKVEFLIAITIIVGIIFSGIYIAIQIRFSKFILAMVVNLIAPYFSLLFSSLISQAYKAGKEI